MVSLIIGGDIVPSFNNLEAFKRGEIENIVDKECQHILMTADFRVFNLETPLTGVHAPMDKEGANFSVSIQAVQGLKALNVDVLSLANNHCKDQGAIGLQETVDVLRDHGITPIGYGKDDQNCDGTAFLTKDGITVAVVVCAETEFTLWNHGEIGAVPYHDYYTNRRISEAKQRADAVIVLYHGGKEYFTYVAPYQMERCHLMVDCGADFVFCQHSHCVSCYEEYHGGTILYGQGNFIFHQRNNIPQTKEGLLAKISVDKTQKSVEFIPIHLDQSDRACITKAATEMLIAFNSRSIQVKDLMFVMEKYREFASQKADAYYARLQGSNRLLRFVRRVLEKTGVKFYQKQDKLALLNLLQNEAHRELFIQALKDEIENEKGK